MSDLPYNGTPPKFLGPDEFAKQLEAAPEHEKAKATKASEELKRWHRFPGQPWTPPDTLTETAIDVLADQPNIGLDAAINLMVFGQIYPNPLENLESRARRQQALNAICNSKKFTFIQGGASVNVPEDIPQSLWPTIKIREAADFVALLRARVGISPELQAPAVHEKPAPKKRGPKDKWDWPRGRKYALGELVARGDFDDFQNQYDGWKSQADLVKLVQSYLDEIGDNGEPSDTQTKEKVALWIAEFRAGIRH